MKMIMSGRSLAPWLVGVGLLVVGGPQSITYAQSGEPLITRQDVLSITVAGQPDLSRKFNVDADGRFVFPLIGRVDAAGFRSAMSRTRLEAPAGGRFSPKPSDFCHARLNGRKVPQST
jgi:protein involved in polysaccharide export with SLBB domain